MAAASRIEGIAGGGRGPGSYSYRGSELTAAERRALTKQNKSAESLKNKDLDKMDKNKAAYAKQKAARAAELKGVYKSGQKVGATKAVTGVAILGALGQKAADKVKAQKKSTAKATPKATPKVTPKAKPKKYTKSEQNFLDGQKLKKKILKKTGIYPNTAD
jgi:hypothetical protein